MAGVVRESSFIQHSIFLVMVNISYSICSAKYPKQCVILVQYILYHIFYKPILLFSSYIVMEGNYYALPYGGVIITPIILTNTVIIWLQTCLCVNIQP